MAGSEKTLSGRPLRATAADDRLYVPVPEIEERLTRSVRRELNTLVLGKRGSGKTSLLQHLLFKQGDKFPISYVNAESVQRPGEIVEHVRAALGTPQTAFENARSGFLSLADVSRLSESAVLLDRLAALRDVEPHVVIVDGIQQGDTIHALFGRLRDDIWNLPHTWVVTADVEQRAAALSPPADAFFETVLTVPQLQPSQARAILARRLPDAAGLDPLIGHHETPRQLLSSAREVVVMGRAADEVVASAQELRSGAAGLGQSARRMLAAMEDLGRPVSASDAELLRRLDVTRERAAQVLNRLEQGGVVRSATVATGAKPRKMFEIAHGRRDGA